MNRWITLCLCLGVVTSIWAAEPEVRVFCPAVGFDDYNERGRSGADGPHPVMLMVVGKTIKTPPMVSATKKQDSEDESDERPDRAASDLIVEKVLFGSPPGEKIHIPADYGSFPKDSDTLSHIYGFVTSNRGDKETLAYRRDDYYFYDRTYSVEQLSQVEALARARLDLLTLSSDAVFIGQPDTQTKPSKSVARLNPFGPSATPVSVELKQVLYGQFKAGERITVSREEQNAIPLVGEGPFIYFVRKTDKPRDRQIVHLVTTRWATTALPTVLASLARRKEYPILDKTDDDGIQTREQEILFLGPRSLALELLQGHGKPLEILGARRILSDGTAAIPDVLALIERHLWLEQLDNEVGFRWQNNLIEILSKLEHHRTDGHVTRLIDAILTKAEQGANFPAPPPDPKDTERNQWRSYGNQLDEENNHSLAWLLRTLDEKAAARLFGARLLKIRDLAAYGWKEEAQFVIDASHIEDHLELEKLKSLSNNPTPIQWTAGFRGENLGAYRVVFSADGKWFAAVGKFARIWNTVDWSLVGEFDPTGSVSEIAFAPDGESLYVAGGGSVAILDRWNWRTGKVIQKYAGHESAITAMQISGDGRWLLSSDGPQGSTILFNANTGVPQERLLDVSWLELKLSADGQRFLGGRPMNWWLGETNNKKQKKLLSPAIKVAWAKEGFWSLEEAGSKPVPDKSDSPEKTALSGPLADPFGADEAPAFRHERRPLVIRQRRLDEQQSAALERPLKFAAHTMLVDKEGKSIVVLNDSRVEAFKAHDLQPLAAWTFPQQQNNELARFNTHRKSYQLSPDAKWLVLAEEYSFPKIYLVENGRRVALGSGHGNEITAMDFFDRDIVRTRDAEGIVLRWNAGSGKKLKAVSNDSKQLAVVELRDRAFQKQFVAEDGTTWQFNGRGGGKYGRYTSFEIRVTEKGLKPEEDNDEKPRRGTKVLGVIEPNWGQHDWVGLVPGGEYLHIGTQIYSRRDLKPISVANVQGEIEQIIFSGDGNQYAVLTIEFELRSLGHNIARREITSQLLRVHETRTGETLLAIPTSNLRLIAFSPDQSKLAAINDHQQMSVWQIKK